MPINLINPDCRGTIKGAVHFNPVSDAKVVRDLIKADKADSIDFIELVTSRSNAQRNEIKLSYNNEYERDLLHDLKSATHGDYEAALVGLFELPHEYDAHCLHKFISGLGTDEKSIVEILISRSNEEIRKISSCYLSKYGKKLTEAIEGDTSGDFRDMLIVLAKGTREEDFNNTVASNEKYVDQLCSSSENLIKGGLAEMFYRKCYPELREIFGDYEKKAGSNIVKKIKSDTHGDFKDGLVALVEFTMDPIGFFVEKLYRSMKGVGTQDFTLTRTLISRSEVDLEDIKERYEKEHGKPLAKYVESDTSGAYKKLLLAIIK